MKSCRLCLSRVWDLCGLLSELKRKQGREPELPSFHSSNRQVVANGNRVSPPHPALICGHAVSIFLCNRLHWLFSCSKSQVKFGKEATVPSLTYTGTKSQDSPDQGSRQSQGTQFNDKCTVTGASMALAVQRCLPEDSDGMLATWLLLKRLHHLLCADCRGRSGRGMLPGLSTTQLAVLQTLQRLWV